jgi:DNA-binding NtrC family response regulator
VSIWYAQIWNRKPKKWKSTRGPTARCIIQGTHILEELIGNSAPMRLLNELTGKISRSNSPVFLSGETGTGKEVVARAIPSQEVRREKVLVPVDCLALTPTLVESQLFGHIGPPDRNELVPLAEIELRGVLHALRETGGDKHAAARLLGIGKSTFYRKLKGYTTPPLPKDQEPREGH